MAKVYIVQRHLTRDIHTGALKEKLDMSPARAFGELVYLLENDPVPGRTQTYVEDMAAALDNFSDEDFLLLTGSPVLIGVAFALAADANGGRVRVLQYNRKHGRYEEIPCSVWSDEPGE